MTRFEDGPAAGQALMIKRVPKLMRVVQDAGGQWDALDQIEDVARAGETLHAYEITAKAGVCHIYCGGKGRSGFYAMATYRLVRDQPADEVMRDNRAWRDWCRARVKAGDEKATAVT